MVKVEPHLGNLYYYSVQYSVYLSVLSKDLQIDI